jgi:hypothetical protein
MEVSSIGDSEMNRNQKIFKDFNSFLLKIKGIGPRMLEYGISFNLKVFGLREMHLRTLGIRTLAKAKALERAQIRESAQAKSVIESGAVFFAKDTDEAHKDTIACFETYLNAPYSLLQVITKIQPQKGSIVITLALSLTMKKPEAQSIRSRLRSVHYCCGDRVHYTTATKHL